MILTLEQTAAPATFHTDNDLIIQLAEDGDAEALFKKLANNSITKRSSKMHKETCMLWRLQAENPQSKIAD